MSASELKFLIDVGVGIKIARYLREEGYDIKAVRDIDSRMEGYIAVQTVWPGLVNPVHPVNPVKKFYAIQTISRPNTWPIYAQIPAGPGCPPNPACDIRLMMPLTGAGCRPSSTFPFSMKPITAGLSGAVPDMTRPNCPRHWKQIRVLPLWPAI